jgi:hypothetical protein
MDKPGRPLLPPPRLQRRGEPRAIIEPPLRDLAASRPPEPVDEWAPFKSGKAENVLTDDLGRRAQATALASARVKRLLATKRYVAIGASLRERRDVSKDKAFSLVYVFYNYTDNLTVEATLDRHAKAVASVAESRYQPPPIREEIDQVIALARRDSRLAERLTDEFEAGAIVVSPVDPEDPNYGHRQFDVRFFCPTDRLPSYMALVDLSTERVLKAGPLCSSGSYTTGGA